LGDGDDCGSAGTAQLTVEMRVARSLRHIQTKTSLLGPPCFADEGAACAGAHQVGTLQQPANSDFDWQRLIFVPIGGSI